MNEAVNPDQPNGDEGQIEWYKKQLGQQANEIGELRNTIQQYIEKQDQDFLAESFDIDQLSAIEKTVEKKLKPIQDKLSQSDAAIARDRLSAKHPDWESVVNSPKFQAWVAEDPIVRSAYETAVINQDLDTGIALIDQFKGQNQKPSQDVLQTALSSSRGTSGDVAAPDQGMMSRAEIRHLKMTDPAKYRAMSKEILKAYAENRVR